jgi:hypothetical protein
MKSNSRDAVGGFVGDLFVAHGVLYFYRNGRAQASRGSRRAPLLPRLGGAL